MIYDNKDKICRVCGCVVQEGKILCLRCEETFALCDIEDYVNCKNVESSEDNATKTLLNSSSLW